MCETLGCLNDADLRVWYISPHFGPEDSLTYTSVCEKCLPDLRTHIREVDKRVGPVVEL